MSHLLELLGRGLSGDIGDLLDRYFWSPQTRSIEELRSQCSQHPDWPDLHFQLGVAYLRAVQLDEAVSYLTQACRRKPGYIAARLALASALEEKSDTAGALEQLKIANQTRPSEVPVLFAIGFCLEKLCRPGDAAEYYRDAIAREPSFVPARQRLAALDVYRGELDEAIRQYEDLCRIGADQGWVHGALGHLNYRAGRYAESIEHFQAAIVLEPENWALVDDEVESLIADGHIREAMERLHGLIEQQGPFPDLYARLADLYSRCGDDEAATKYYLSALDVQPNYLEATVKLGTHHLIFGRWERAAEAFHQAAELSEKLLTNYVGVGVAQLAAGKKGEAMNSFDLAAAVEPNGTLLLTEMARLQLKAAVGEEFERSFQVAQDAPVAEIELDNDDLLHRQIERHGEEVLRHPQHADLRYRYGVLLRSQGRLGEAMDEFAKAVEINPAYVRAIIKLGVTQQELGMVDQAVETFKKVLEVHPKFVDLHYRLGLLYTDRRQFAEAVRHMEAAADGAPDNDQVRAGLALSLQNMGLMDRAAATWRSLWKIHHAKA